MRTRPTMRDVATRAGVSQTTVSLVLNNTETTNIPDATRAKVFAAARDLGYRIDASARALRAGTTRTLGLITDEIASGPYAGEIIGGAQDAAWDAGHVLLVVNTGGRPDVERAAVEVMLERNVDGVIFTSYFTRLVTPPPTLAQLPTVLVNCFTAELTYPTFIPDELECGRAATQLLLDRGHRTVAHITGLLEAFAGEKRLEGYKQALNSAGLPVRPELVVQGDWWPSSGYEGMLKLFEVEDRPTAVVCGNDRMALGVYMAAKELGVRIPGELAVVGCDDQDFSARLEPPLSSLKLPFYEMGNRAARYLIDHGASDDLQGATLESIPLNPFVRESIAEAGPRPKAGPAHQSTAKTRSRIRATKRGN